MKAPQLPKAKLLIEAADQLNRTDRRITDGRNEIATLLRQYRLLENEIEAVNSQLAEMAKTTEEYDIALFCSWIRRCDDC